ncbi:MULTISPECIES: tetratricopeptide repeat protein [Metallosphaera]|uniref:tetratricopeptide repeat protein n=2 Tax=Sulfolobaceae TaxID=118883 RepID=UPI001F066C65|nr:tetratricopeptide repeat protein [Metallosphaera sedula]MCH1770087.1 tetratricopeptide repeat protein [Metallosphaera sedula]MCP6728079.1 tetratricopeptide repeat protein [Metallosphaera sedula]
MDISNLLQSGNLNLALLKLREMVEQNPSKENYQLLGRVLLELGRDEEAIDAFIKGEDYVSASRLLALKDPDTTLDLLRDKQSKEAKIIRAMLLLRKERYDEALREIENIEDKDALLLKVKGISEYFTGRFYEALRDLSRAISYYPLDADLFYFRALTRISLGDEQNAEKDLDIAINLNPYYAEAYLNKGILTEKKGDIQGAIKLYTKSIDLKPNYKEAYIRRSKAYHQLGREEEAKSDLAKSEKLD